MAFAGSKGQGTASRAGMYLENKPGGANLALVFFYRPKFNEIIKHN